MPSRKALLNVVAAAALVASCGLAIGGRAAAWSPPAAPSVPMPGGYSNVPVTDPEVVTAAKFAVARLRRPGARLARIEDAQRQVVAGTNYRIRVTLTDGSRWSLEVFRPLRGKMVAGAAQLLPPLSRKLKE